MNKIITTGIAATAIVASLAAGSVAMAADNSAGQPAAASSVSVDSERQSALDSLKGVKDAYYKLYMAYAKAVDDYALKDNYTVKYSSGWTAAEGINYDIVPEYESVVGDLDAAAKALSEGTILGYGGYEDKMSDARFRLNSMKSYLDNLKAGLDKAAKATGHDYLKNPVETSSAKPVTPAKSETSKPETKPATPSNNNVKPGESSKAPAKAPAKSETKSAESSKAPAKSDSKPAEPSKAPAKTPVKSVEVDGLGVGVASVAAGVLLNPTQVASENPAANPAAKSVEKSAANPVEDKVVQAEGKKALAETGANPFVAGVMAVVSAVVAAGAFVLRRRGF